MMAKVCVLSFTQLSGTDPEAQPRTDTRTVLRTALANLRTSIVEAKALVTHDDLPTVSVNPTGFLQVLQNLIGNAIQYRSGVQLRIHISAASQRIIGSSPFATTAAATSVPVTFRVARDQPGFHDSGSDASGEAPHSPITVPL